MVAFHVSTAGEKLDAVMGIGLAGLFFLTIKVGLLTGPGRKVLEALISSNKRLLGAQVTRLVSQTASRLVGSVHNVIQIPFALYLLNDELLQSDHIYANTPLSKVCMTITAGYFMVDLFICIWKYNDEGPLYLMHAAFSFFSFAYGVINNMLHFYGAAFIMWELSTPFVHLRWLLHKMDMNNTRFYIINGALMILTFFASRCIWGLWVSYDFWVQSMKELAHPTPDGFPAFAVHIYRLANICLTALNIYWFCKMMTKAIAVLMGSSSAEKDMYAKGE